LRIKRHHEFRARKKTAAGSTFKHDFADLKIDFVSVKQSKTDLYEGLEVALNAGQAELPDIAKLRQQLLTLVVRGASIDHQPGAHNDFANAAAGALVLVGASSAEGWIRLYRDMPARIAAQEAVAVPAPSATQVHGHLGFMQGIAPWPRDASKLARNLNRRAVKPELFSAAKSNTH
jgi:hypothetical protein